MNQTKGNANTHSMNEDQYLREKWERSKTPQWQLNLLARFPRPLAVILIGFLTWFWDEGIVWLIVFLWFAIPTVLALLVTKQWEWGGVVFLGNLFGSALLLVLVVSFGEWYSRVDKTLPKREKKPDDVPDEGEQERG